MGTQPHEMWKGPGCQFLQIKWYRQVILSLQGSVWSSAMTAPSHPHGSSWWPLPANQKQFGNFVPQFCSVFLRASRHIIYLSPCSDRDGTLGLMHGCQAGTLPTGPHPSTICQLLKSNYGNLKKKSKNFPSLKHCVPKACRVLVISNNELLPKNHFYTRTLVHVCL